MKRDPERIKGVIRDVVDIFLKLAALVIFILFCLVYVISAGYAM